MQVQVLSWPTILPPCNTDKLTELNAFEVWGQVERNRGAKADKAMSAPCKEHLEEGTSCTQGTRILEGTRVLAHICRAHSF